MKKNGFTLIEILTAMSVFVIIAALSTPYLFGTLEKKRLLTERDKVENMIKEAQQLSRVAQEGENYGVDFGDRSLILLPNNESIVLNQSVRQLTSNQSPVYFQKLSGIPILDENLTAVEVRLSGRSFSTSIVINQTGVIHTTDLVTN